MRIIKNLAEIAARYDAAFVDLWGCLHDGYQPFPAALAALGRWREGGGRVVLLTNSPRPRASVRRQLDKIGVPGALYDDIAASGDASQFSLAAGDVGARVHHLGPERDRGFFQDLPEVPGGPDRITLAPLDQAEGIVCTGLFDDETETPEDYRATLLYAKTRGMRLLCTNPDLVVDKGGKRIYCAGAIAELYTEMGGESLKFGKPHPLIYDLARQRLAAFADIPDQRILCIGDGLNTDIQGAIAEDLDCLFITGGLAAVETGTGPSEDDQPDPALLDPYLNDRRLSPPYAIGHLR